MKLVVKYFPISGSYRCEVSHTRSNSTTRTISRQVFIPYLSEETMLGFSTYMIEGNVFKNKSELSGWMEELKGNCSHYYVNGVLGQKFPEYGVHQCFTENLDSNIAAEHTDYFTVQEETLQITGVKSTHIKINKTEDVTLECIVTGYPLKVLSWIKNGDITLNASSSRLLWRSPNSITLSNVVLEDAGFYQCVTDTGVQSERIKVEVEVPSKLISMTTSRSEYVEGDEVVFDLVYEVNEHDACTVEVFSHGDRVWGEGVSSERVKLLQIDSSSRYAIIIVIQMF